jgi:hypothetical protein
MALFTLAAALLSAGLFISTAQARPSESNGASLRPVSPSWCASRCDDVITDWSLTAYQVIKTVDGYADPSALGMAAAVVLAEAFGRDHLPFSFASSSALADNAVRSFRSFSEAARENADSRVMAGLHFRFATDAGLGLGRAIGQHVNRHALRQQRGAAVDD